MTARRGFALVMALLALVCGSALLAALSLVSREEVILSDLARRSHVALGSAERAAWTAAAALAPTDFDRLVGLPRDVAMVAKPADSITASLVRLEGDLFLAVGEAISGGNGRYARRRVGVLVRGALDSAGSATWAPLSDRYWMDLP